MATAIEAFEGFDESKALDFIISTLQQQVSGEPGFANIADARYDFTAVWLFEKLMHSHSVLENNEKENAMRFVTSNLQSALWQLCLKNVIRPTIRDAKSTVVFQGAREVGMGYCYTDKGIDWLKNQSELSPILLSAKALSNQLLKHADQFGDGYAEKSLEAVRCYEAQCYLACCVLCGAASEAIFLAMAIEKEDEDAILKKYQSRDGRKYLFDFLLSQEKDFIKDRFRAPFNLIGAWRDASAHGIKTDANIDTATNALIQLLSLCDNASKYWDQLTEPA